MTNAAVLGVCMIVEVVLKVKFLQQTLMYTDSKTVIKRTLT